MNSADTTIVDPKLTYKDLPPLIGMKMADAMVFTRACSCKMRISNSDGIEVKVITNIIDPERLNLAVYHGVVVGTAFY